MSKTVTVNGIEEISQKLKQIGDGASFMQAMGKACALVERAAKEKAPKGNSGNLRNSITSKIERENGNIVGTVYTPLEYAPYVEFGTGLFAEGGKGRKEVPWVYVEGSSNSGNSSKKVYTEQEARATVEFLQDKGLDAKLTYGEYPNPFMRPALIENKQNIIKILKEGAKPND
jgi:HK97 gp10 family phage protein